MAMDFKPMFSPQEMLKKGIFGGEYFYNYKFNSDLPKNYFIGIEKSYYRSSKYDPLKNCFKVRSGQTREDWKKNGWMHADDQRGWFEWYCKYYLGRRHIDDERQIKRWLSFCGPKGRWRNSIYSKIHSYGIDIKLSSNFSIRIQQSLLHWSYMINEQDYKLWMKNKKK